MARVISCKYCGKQFSSDQVHCPHCGLNKHGYQCLICHKKIASPHDPTTICFLPKNYDVGALYFARKEWAYHSKCLNLIRHLPYVCPVCKTRLSHLDMGAMTEELRKLQPTWSGTGHRDTQPTHIERCPNCGHSIPIEFCAICKEAVIADGISGVTLRGHLRTAPLHKFCMTSTQKATQRAARWDTIQSIVQMLWVSLWVITQSLRLGIRGGALFIIFPVLIFVVTVMVTHNMGLSIGLSLIGYLVTGGIVTRLTGGVFCDKITQKNLDMGTPSQEFLHAYPPTSTLGEITGVRRGWNADPADTTAVTFEGIGVVDEERHIRDIWISPFTNQNDAVCLHVVSEESATIEYFTQKPPRLSSSILPIKLIFIDDGSPKIRLVDELQLLEDSGKFQFFLCPAEPCSSEPYAWRKTITLYGFGAWSNYRATVTNPHDLPYVYRSRSKIFNNRLNYMWAIPVDIIITPIYFLVFWVWWCFFVRF